MMMRQSILLLPSSNPPVLTYRNFRESSSAQISCNENLIKVKRPADPEYYNTRLFICCFLQSLFKDFLFNDLLFLHICSQHRLKIPSERHHQKAECVCFFPLLFLIHSPFPTYFPFPSYSSAQLVGFFIQNFFLFPRTYFPFTHSPTFSSKLLFLYIIFQN